MKRATMWWTVGILVTVLLVAPLAMGAAGAEGGGGWRDRPIARLIATLAGQRTALAQNLKVTDAQKEQIAAVVQQFKPELAAAMKDMVAKKRAVGDLIRDSKSTDRDIRNAVDDLARVGGDTCVLMAKVYRKVEPILTAEQRKTLDSYRGDREGAVDEWLREIGQ